MKNNVNKKATSDGLGRLVKITNNNILYTLINIYYINQKTTRLKLS